MVGGKASPDTGPTGPSYIFTVEEWFSERWGAVFRWTGVPGRRNFPAPIVYPDRVELGAKAAKSLALTVRRRMRISPSWRLEIGGGVALFGLFDVVVVRTGSDQQRSVTAGMAGPVVDVVFSRRLADRLVLKIGTFVDLNYEEAAARPLAAASLGF